MKFLSIFFLTLSLASGLSAQNLRDSTVTAERWQLSLQLGHQLGSSKAGPLSGVTHQYYRAAAYYRFAPGFDLGVSFGYNRGAGDRIRASEGVSLLGAETPYRHLENSYLLGVNPRANYRIGRGDLDLTLGLGIMHHRHAKWLTQFGDGDDIRVDYAPITKPYGEIGAGYTYWVWPKVGLTASASYLRLLHDGDYEVNRILELGLAEEELIDVAFKDSASDWSQVYLSIGMVVRPF
ncbi:hypothetical protein [Neolewinella antarctica]|uniref:Outer membrane protein beta-barrel domain-containing protein n=1 Tax=Neolewinella antarctica TaxID=442734 RepID=A0ABX0X871_9BACT|nr:hypothetical protein [Neolewinella antarctica]NJC25250.1 hypothetical protein [Neolewinella antarctica]